MTDYRGLEEQTTAVLKDGWLHTGDLGDFDDDGYLTIRDRLKDMVIVGGYNVYPREIDEVLFVHPIVVDAAAVGIEDSYRGQVIHAFIVVADGIESHDAAIESLSCHCAQNLAKYKCPTQINIVAALPKTTVNKTDKNALRDIARQARRADFKTDNSEGHST